MEIFKILLALMTSVAVVYFLVKKYDTKLVLLVAGVFMALVALEPMTAFNAFANRMATNGLIQAICSVLGFAAVVKITGCDKHMINMLAGILKRTGIFLVPVATLLTFTINIAVPSASGCAAAIGAIFIPLLIHSGVSPVMAAAAVFSGTYGSILSPGLSHNIFVAKLANIPVLEVINAHKMATISSIVVAAITLGIVAIYLKEHKGYVSTDEDFKVDTEFKVNPIFALVNIVPLVILILGFTGAVPALKMGVAQAMLIGAFIAVIITRTSPSEVSKKFFDGMGGAYANILGIIITATVFVSGLKALGLIDIFIDIIISNPSLAGIGATLGPFFLSIMTGSGDAASFTFNEIITFHANTFGMSIENMGSLIVLSGAIGRTMSPLAGAAIICAGFAKVSTIDVVKRTSFGMVLALITVYIILAI
ncbi:C4-dicarboxylate transporter, DcuC family [Malaciobacter marinus]|uniref:C4-dicarboxylate transporter, DcuC family n=3 Tax=Malaciobacter marinus TaxID=505249 RepID=A0A347TNQ9_9BACT|nr:C4-dicarboxylate transporter DcuC [Malaciobacter marinus]AXX88237.1 C4-dicarboxylate transporter, DcuC family [Malaciobacter marinus]